MRANGSEFSYQADGELDLLSAAQSGDQQAFGELCRRHGPYLERRIRRIVRNLEDAEDVFQETLMSAFRHLRRFRAQCTFRTWITRIAINTSLMLLRKRRNRPETGLGFVTDGGKEVLQISDPMPDPEQVYAKRQTSQRVSQAIKMLPTGFRVIVEYHHQHEIKLVDAANAIGITVGAAKSRLLRARIALRRHLRNDGKLLS
jgi:RNA polymerase sigma-70 factor, ECF subfamily